MNQKQSTLATYLKRSKQGIVVIALFSMVINILMLVSPIFMLQMYDRVLSSQSFETLIALTFIAVFLLGIMALLDISRQRVASRISMRLGNQLSDKLFISIFQMQQHAEAEKKGTLPLQDLEQVKKFLSEPSIFSFFDSPWVPLYILIVYIMHPFLGYLAIAGAIIIFGMAILGEIISREHGQQASQESQQAMNLAQTSLRNSEVILSMNILKGLQKKWDSSNNNAMQESHKVSNSIGMMSASVKTFRLVLQIGILATGATLAMQNELTPGAMIASSIIIGRALQPVEQSVVSWRGFMMMRGAWKRLNQLIPTLEEEEEYVPLPRPKEHLIVSELFVTHGDKPILKNINFGVKMGEVLSVIGPSGAGKSTLLQALVGLIKPRAGEIRLDGVLVSNWNLEDRGQYIGYLPQDIELFDGTVADNIARFTEVDNDKVIEATNLAGSHNLIVQLEKNYSTDIGEYGDKLSGGQRQRIALSRAIYNNPAFIVLDEPTSNLDYDGEENFYKCISELKKRQNCIVIVVSHSPKIFNVSDKALYLNMGQMQAFGTPSDVMEALKNKQ